MNAIELDDWFFNLPARWQMDITGIYMNEDLATDITYERFDNAVTEWWDSHSYEEKLCIYKNEEPSAE